MIFIDSMSFLFCPDILFYQCILYPYLSYNYVYVKTLVFCYVYVFTELFFSLSIWLEHVRIRGPLCCGLSMIAKAITSQPKTETATVDCLSYDMVQPKPLACHHVEDGLISFIHPNSQGHSCCDSLCRKPEANRTQTQSLVPEG